jgi:hypothetical protein
MMTLPISCLLFIIAAVGNSSTINSKYSTESVEFRSAGCVQDDLLLFYCLCVDKPSQCD